MKTGKPGQRMRWHAVADRVPQDSPIVGVELGVLVGTMSGNLLSLLPYLALYMVDRWSTYTPEEIEAAPRSRMPGRPPEYFNQAFHQAVEVAREYPGRAHIVKADTVEAAETIPGSLDFAFVDARHDEEGLRRDIEAWTPKVRIGGWLFFHDYGSKNHPDVKRVVDELFDEVEVDADHVAAVRVLR